MAASTLRIAYLGPAGTFTEQALLGEEDLAGHHLVPLPRFFDVLAATTKGEVDLGFVAIENAIEGPVNMTLDALAFDQNLLIQREVVLDIHLNLMARPGTALDRITAVASHPVATAQCRNFLNTKLARAEVTTANSTAEAARAAAERPDTAAVGPARAAEQYDLELLATDIADHPGNQTRFVLVCRSGIPAPTGHDKTTVVLSQRQDYPGSLVAILEEFSARSINLSKLTSRPAKRALGQYRFIVDLDGHVADDVVADCLRSVRAKHADVKFLGSYPAAGVASQETRREASEALAEASSWIRSIRDQIRY
jgi:prephenate dehydratase